MIYMHMCITHLSEKPREVLTREAGEAGAVWLWLSAADERLELLALTVSGWAELTPSLAPVNACWAEPRWGLDVMDLVGESIWNTNPVLGSAFSDQVSSSMLHLEKDVQQYI